MPNYAKDGEVSVAGDKGGVRIKGFGKAFDASRVAGNEGVFGAFYHFFGQAPALPSP